MGKDKEEKKRAKEEEAAAAAAAEEKAAKKAAKKAKKEGGDEDDEKAAKKAKKEKKRAAEEAAAAGGDEPAKKKKKADDDDDDEPKVKLSKEEKAAKKAAKAAKKEGGGDFAPPAAISSPAPAGEGELNRIFVGNLPFKMTEDWLKQTIESAGTVKDIDWLMHADTGKWKGSVFCTMESAAEASAAAASLNGKDVEGRPMKVEVATPKKAASGRTPVLEENPPSENVFLGNLSWSVTEEALRALFEPCGAISRIKWLEKDGEFRGMAFLDFETIEAATNAVALNGSDLSGRPVRANFSKPKAPSDNKWGGGGDKWGAAAKPQRPSKPTGDKPDGCVELFCGNLPWSIDETKISDFFAKSGATVTGTRWLNDKESGEFKGIGFVTFQDTADVDKAVSLGGEQLDGRTIRLDYAGQKKKEGAWQGNSW